MLDNKMTEESFHCNLEQQQQLQQPQQQQQQQQRQDQQEGEGDSESDDEEEHCGTSLIVIAQVSDLLNSIYGKTSVSNQINRVSAIMRAYEGRDVVLLELLESKAFYAAKSNAETDTEDLRYCPEDVHKEEEIDFLMSDKAKADAVVNQVGFRLQLHPQEHPPQEHPQEEEFVSEEQRQEESNASELASQPASQFEESENEDSLDYSSDHDRDYRMCPDFTAQVSELLHYVYGKPSPPAQQIDRVSTIMRAYAGQENILLDLLESKALTKANSEQNSGVSLPSFLRDPTTAHVKIQKKG